MGSNFTPIELGKTPSIFQAPTVMVRNIIKNKQLLKNLLSRDFKVNYYGHFLVTFGLC